MSTPAISSPSSPAHVLALPDVVWARILSSPALDYFDIKRFSATCQAFLQAVQCPALDPVLFRSPPPTRLRKGSVVACHPSLSTMDLVKTSCAVTDLDSDGDSSFASPPSSPLDLTEFATSPTVKKMQFRLGPHPVIGNPEGVRVKDVVEGLVNLWNQPCPHNGMSWKWTLPEGAMWEGVERIDVDEEGVAVVTPKSLLVHHG
ncbi:hypothetical protein JCM10212_001298 [Sporobolomyces blumeae]